MSSLLDGARVLVVGLAQTGISVAKLCAARGATVCVTDSKDAASLADGIEALGGVATLELGGHDTASFTGADLVVMSPGVPEMPEMAAARAAGVEVIAEIELAYRLLHPDAILIAITGTNGKSTTTALAGALCEASGVPSFCGGNLGNHPLIEAVDHPANRPGGLVVAEVAGFMLETCNSFRPKVAACLNITEDHLDRYGTMDVYSSMKTRVFAWQHPDDIAIANANDQRTMAGAQASAARVLAFDSQRELSSGAYLHEADGEIVLRLADSNSSDESDSSDEERYPVSDLTIIGRHNMENAMAAYMAARSAGVSFDAIRKGAAAFRPQKHRMELVGRRLVGGVSVEYYDDSKGTNVAAVAASMSGFPRPVVLIAGGVDKGGSYDAMLDELDKVARGLVLIGRAAPIIREAAEAHGARYEIANAETMEEAVRIATEMAKDGDAVVLSPACSSYDMFKNFGERGMAFREALGAIGAARLD